MTELAIYQEMPIDRLADVMFKSGLFSDVRTMNQAIVKVIAGREMGLGPVAAMRGIDIISGKVSISAALTAALVKQTGHYDFRVMEHTDKVCVIAFHQKLDSGEWIRVGDSTFTLDMANRAGLLRNKVWQEYPEAMLWARAMTQGAGWYCPDATDGRVYTSEELGQEPDDSAVKSIQTAASVGVDTTGSTVSGSKDSATGKPSSSIPASVGAESGPVVATTTVPSGPAPATSSAEASESPSPSMGSGDEHTASAGAPVVGEGPSTVGNLGTAPKSRSLEPAPTATVEGGDSEGEAGSPPSSHTFVGDEDGPCQFPGCGFFSDHSRHIVPSRKRGEA